jgi:transcription initiation factor TFIIE subunit beta
VPALRTYIRTNSTPLQGVVVKTLREALPAGGPISIAALEELEAKGDLMIMRGLGGTEFKDVPLPALGLKNAFGVGITEGRNDRWKTVWWDDLKERGRTGKRLTQGEWQWTYRSSASTDHNRHDHCMGQGQDRRE